MGEMFNIFIFLMDLLGEVIFECIDIIDTIVVAFSLISESVDFHLHGAIIDFQFLDQDSTFFILL